jgi:hypothetical protein
LPESKRFAETKEEYTELLLRHNIVATETLGEGSRCYLIQGCWGKPGERQDGWIVAIESEALDIQFGEVETIWNYRQHEGLLQEVADWKTANVIFAACDSGRIYAPYDGGADLIFSNEQERDAKRQAYQAWLSPHLEGL